MSDRVASKLAILVLKEWGSAGVMSQAAVSGSKGFVSSEGERVMICWESETNKTQSEVSLKAWIILYTRVMNHCPSWLLVGRYYLTHIFHCQNIQQLREGIKAQNSKTWTLIFAENHIHVCYISQNFRCLRNFQKDSSLIKVIWGKVQAWTDLMALMA